MFDFLLLLAIICLVFAIFLQPILQEQREQKIAKQMKALREALNEERGESKAAASALIETAIRENEETTQGTKNLRRFNK